MLGAPITGNENGQIHHIPQRATRFYEEQIARSRQYGQLKRIIEPSAKELHDGGLWDTSGEQDDTVMPGLQHKYPETALVMATNQCFAHCRFCFRKRLVGRNSGEIAKDYQAIAAYIRDHSEINNVLLSGGDPFALGTDQLRQIVDHLLPIPHVTAIRFGTKALVYYPLRFNDETLSTMLSGIIQAGKMALIVTHIDHCDEISPETEAHVLALRQRGTQFFNQTVLLKGVNDDLDVLAATFAKLQQMGVQPYYLFQARPVKGSLHFQTPLRRGLEIVQALNRRLSGIQKTYRYIMSHSTGKIEILDLDAGGRLYLRYHQCKDTAKVGRIFSWPYREGVCWLDDLPCAGAALARNPA